MKADLSTSLILLYAKAPLHWWKNKKTLHSMTRTLHTQHLNMILKIPLGTNVPPLATQICTPKFSLIKVPYILLLLNLSHLQISCLKCQDTTMHKHTTSFLSYVLAAMLPTHRAPWGLWRTCPITLGPFYSYQGREIFQHFSIPASTVKQGGRESHGLPLSTDKEVLTPSLQWKNMKCNNMGLSYSTVLSKHVI